MSVLFPWILGIAGSLFTLSILSFYFFKRRHKERKVSALFLWAIPEQLSGEGRKFSKLETNLLMILEILAALCLILAASAPSCARTRHVSDLIFVLDSSASMGVPSCRKAAENAVLEEAKKNVPWRATLIETGKPPRILASGLQKESDLIRALASRRNDRDDHSPKNALALAAQLGGESAQIFWFSDRRRNSGDPEKPEAVHYRSFGHPIDNAGLIQAVRKYDADLQKDHLLAEVLNASDRPKTLRLHLADRKSPDKILYQKELSMNPGETRLVPMEFDSLRDRDLILFLTPHDDFPTDDQALLLSDPVPPLRVALDLKMDSPLRKLLTRTLRAMDPLAKEASFKNAELIFSDNRNDSINRNAWNVYFPAPAAQSGEREFNGNYVMEKNSPIFQNVLLNSIRWTIPNDVPPDAARAATLLSSGEYPLIVKGAFPEFAETFVFHYLPERSNLHRTPAWILLMQNLARMRLAVRPGITPKNLRPGETLRIVDPQQSRIDWKQADDTEKISIPLPGGLGEITPERIGIHQLTGEKSIPVEIAVNLCSRRESDFRDAGESDLASNRKTDDIQRFIINSHQDDSALFLLAALLLLAIRVWIIHKQEERSHGI